jgi:peptide subunit release factor 1 (eRF1)
MLEPSELRRLAELDSGPQPTLSLYLALDQSREARLLSLVQMLKRQEHKMAEAGQGEAWRGMAGDVDKCARLVEELPAGPHKGLALFACSEAGLFKTYTLPLSVPNLLTVGASPYILPLTALAGDHPRALTVVLDRRKARFLLSHLGAVEEIKDLALANEQAPQGRDGDQGRAGDSGLNRRAEEGLARYLKQVVATLMAEFEARACRQLFLGGSKAAVEALQAQLHPYLAAKLGATFICEAGAPLSQLAEQVSQAQAEAGRQRQAKLLATLGENLGGRGQAAPGLIESLAALHEGRVHTLFVRRGFTHAGGACPACGRLRDQAGPCSLCKAEMTPVEDVVNLAAARALDSGAALVQVEGPSPLDAMGGMAALLRYA